MAQDIRSFVSQKRYEGMKDDELRAQLMKAGYPETDIDAALSTPMVTSAPAQEPVSKPEPINTPVASEPAGMPMNKRSLYLLGGILFLLTITGTGFYLFYTSPQQVLKRMMTKMQKVKTFTYSLNTALSGKTVPPSFPLSGSSSSKPSSIAVDFHIGGSSEYFDGKKLNGFIQFSGNYEADKQKYSIGKWEVRGIDKKAYIGLQEKPVLGPSLSILDGYEDTWLEVDLTEYLKKLPDVIKSEDKQKQEKQTKEIEKILKKRKIITKYESLATENLNGVSTHHYRLSVDKEAAVLSAAEIYAVINPESVKKADPKADPKEDTVDFVIKPIEIWVGKKDELLYKVTSVLDVKDKKKPENGTLSVMLGLGMSDHNKPITTKLPTGKIWTVDTLMQNIQEKAASESGSSFPYSSPYPSSYQSQRPLPVLGAKTKKVSQENMVATLLLLGALSSIK